MKRKITLEFILMISISLIIFIFGVTLLVRSNINRVSELNLNKYLEIVTTDYNAGDSPEQVVDKYRDIDDYLRITFMDSSGVVVADSLAENLENHLNRPEFNDLGTVYIRHSHTLDIQMMYLAYKLDDNMFVRVSIPTRSILPFLNDFIGLSIVIGVVISILTSLLSNVLVKRTLQPLIEMKGNLKDLNNGVYSKVYPVKDYEEINDLVREINEVSKTISDNISSLKYEKMKNDFLLNHMNQGVCVLDNERRIILLNQYLRDLYNFNIDININKDYRFLFRDEEIQAAVEKAFENETSTNMVYHVNEEYYTISINYLEENWISQKSVILIYTNVTEMKNIEKLKRDFFINASHELKSPLTSILGFSEIISEGMAKDEESIVDLSKKISEEAIRMNNLVMDMLTLSQYENQDETLKKYSFNLDKAILEVIDSLKILAKKNNVTIHYENFELYIDANYEQIYQLMKNLIENSIKYGKQNGNVWINIEKTPDNLMIEIRDDGIGISKADQSRVFERFFRVDKARSKSSGGTGLGLSIVKHIVMNYNGHIELDSSEEGGTSVKIFLPAESIKLV